MFTARRVDGGRGHVRVFVQVLKREPRSVHAESPAQTRARDPDRRQHAVAGNPLAPARARARTRAMAGKLLHFCAGLVAQR